MSLQFISRAAPRAVVDVHRRSPMGVVRVGLFETSGDVNNCASRTGNLIHCLDADVVTRLRARYGAGNLLFLPRNGNVLMYAATPTKPEPTSFAADKKFYEAWRGFRQTFLDWREDWDNQWFSILSADAYRECEKFDLEAKDWHDRFTKFGIVPSCPKTTTLGAIPGIDPPTPPNGKKPEGALDSLVTLAKWGVAGVLVVGIVSVLRGG